ncbi:FAD-binding domain-containing protein [Hymenopellis radicata]|nr:FAD-binding domain-containing protein [Hymenopellis radicata]
MQMFSIASSNTWDALNATVGGRLFGGLPLAYSCVQDPASPQCSNVTHNYLNEVFRASNVGGFVNAQWESCQATGEQCLLDYTNTSDLRPITGADGCHLGSVSKFYIDVREPTDVSAAFAFSTEHHVPLVVKNTGHDYKGRSSAPATLGLWTHNLKQISYSAEFIPEGCSDTPASTPAVTIGAGVQWYEAYAFAEANNITLVGGTDRSVGASGGWLMGGGHSLLSNTMGLGVDRVVQFKVVTPDGQYRTANACQNQDLFYALRGGGGGTFGVVLESTSIASPPVTLQTVIVSFSPTSDPSLTEEMWSILVGNSAKWAEDGWGGISNQQAAIYINPVLDAAAAKASMAPLLAFGQRLVDEKIANASLIVTTFPTWYSFFAVFSSQFVARSGIPVAIASRLISKSNFETAASQKDLVSALTAANDATGSVILLFTAPASFSGDNTTSVTEAWRDSLTHVTLVTTWNWNATKEEKEGQYAMASSAIDHLRKITPDAAYVNEADVYEPNHEATFWGAHYDNLLAIKQKYDPNQLLDCWHCVGWKPESSLYDCYLPRD